MRLLVVALIAMSLAGCVSEDSGARSQFDAPGLTFIEEKPLVAMETMIPDVVGKMQNFVTVPLGSAPGNVTYSMQYYDMGEPTVYCFASVHEDDHWNLVRDGFHLVATHMSCSLYAMVDGEKQYYASEFALNDISHAWLPGALPAELVDWGIEMESVQEFRHESGDYSMYIVIQDSQPGDELDAQIGRLHPDDFPPKVAISTRDDVVCADGSDIALVNMEFPQLRGEATIDFAPNTPLSSEQGTISGTTVSYEASATLEDRVTLDLLMESPSPAPTTEPCTMGSLFTETQTWSATTTVWGMTQDHSFDVTVLGTTGALP
ncbi:MAG: hypothetical protein ACPHK8_00350 [Thermoplasmatota archaeon]